LGKQELALRILLSIGS